MSRRLKKGKKNNSDNVYLRVFHDRNLIEIISKELVNAKDVASLSLVTSRLYKFGKLLNKDVYLAKKCIQYVMFKNFVTTLLECSIILRTNQQSILTQYVTKKFLAKTYVLQENLLSNLEKLVSICHFYYGDGSCEFISHLANKSTTDLKFYLWIMQALYLISCDRIEDGIFLLSMFATNNNRRFVIEWMWHNRLWDYLYYKCPLEMYPVFMNSFRADFYLELSISHNFCELFCASSFVTCQILVQRISDALEMLENPQERLQAHRIWTAYLMSFNNPTDVKRISDFTINCIDAMFTFNYLIATLSLKKVLPYYCVNAETTVSLLELLFTPSTMFEEIVSCCVSVVENFTQYTRQYINYLRLNPDCKVISPGQNFPLRESDITYCPNRWFKLNTIVDEQRIAEANCNLVRAIYERGLCKNADYLKRAEESFSIATKLLDRKERQCKRLYHPVFDAKVELND